MPSEEQAAGAARKPTKLAHRYRIEIFEAWCKACGICVAFCPRGCLVANEEGAPVTVAADKCNGCGWCEIHCPDFAIAVREETARDETSDRDDV